MDTEDHIAKHNDAFWAVRRKPDIYRELWQPQPGVGQLGQNRGQSDYIG
jgi:hypothetical protein